LVRQRERAEGAEKAIRDYEDSARQAKRMLKKMVAQQEATIQRRVASVAAAAAAASVAAAAAAAAAAMPRQVERVFVNVHDLTGDDDQDGGEVKELDEAEKAPLVQMPSLVQDEVAKEGEPECGLCMSNKAIILVAPCGHSSLCYGCASQVVKSDKKECPFCRGKIAAVYHIKMI